MDGPEVLRPRDVLARLARGLDRDAVGPLTSESAIIVDTDDDDGLDELANIALPLPCVVVGVGSPRPHLPLDFFDVLLTSAPSPPRPWVQADVREVVDAIDGSTTAAVTLTQVLRIGEHVDVQHAILLESLAYGLLQVGPRFETWLQQRGARRHHDAADPAVLVDRAGDTVHLTLNRPQVRNAYDSAMRDALVEGLQLALADDSVTRVELRGAGPSFCSGGDLSEFGTTPDATVGHLVRSTRGAAALLAALAPRVHAYVHGACVGAGTELPAFAGTVHARDDATFALPEVRMGLVPGAGGTASVPRRIGRHRTAWLAITGASIDAPTALDWGLVDEVEGTTAR